MHKYINSYLSDSNGIFVYFPKEQKQTFFWTSSTPVVIVLILLKYINI